MDGASKFIDKQNKAVSKTTPKGQGKFTVDNFEQLSRMPGVKKIVGRRS